MIQVCSPNETLIRSIHDDEFFNHISAGELLEDHPKFDKANSHWNFVIFPQERVHDLCLYLKPEFVTSTLQQAYEQQLGVIEVCKGDFSNPTWFPITSHLNIGELKKNWYFAYCRAHGYTISENDVVCQNDTRDGQ